jgi:hypothetical protein
MPRSRVVSLIRPPLMRAILAAGDAPQARLPAVRAPCHVRRDATQDASDVTGYYDRCGLSPARRAAVPMCSRAWAPARARQPHLLRTVRSPSAHLPSPQLPGPRVRGHRVRPRGPGDDERHTPMCLSQLCRLPSPAAAATSPAGSWAYHVTSPIHLFRSDPSPRPFLQRPSRRCCSA